MKQRFLETLKRARQDVLELVPRSTTRRPEPRPPGQPFHAVTVRTRGKSCAAAGKIAGRLFLSGQAPPLPLPGCDQTSCGCTYRHFSDRRQEARRDKDDGPNARGSFADSRRNRGRRAADHTPKPEDTADYFQHTEETQRLQRLQPGDCTSE